jgi:hypothetical protein
MEKAGLGELMQHFAFVCLSDQKFLFAPGTGACTRALLHFYKGLAGRTGIFPDCIHK